MLTTFAHDRESPGRKPGMNAPNPKPAIELIDCGPRMRLRAAASPAGLIRLDFDDSQAHAPDDTAPDPAARAHLASVTAELAAYFANELREFRTPLAPAGTDFQQSVWRELLKIPFGQTRSYAQIAAAIGRPAAVRAVARANATNPIAIIIPCHRVIGSDGTLTGYGGGLARKRFLLDHERAAAGVSGLLLVG